MSDKGPSLAESLYPSLPGAPDTRPDEPAPSDAAKALYGDGGDKATKLVDGASPLGGQARPATLLGEPKPGEAPKPIEAGAPFNPAMVKIEGMQADPVLMGEFGKAAQDLGLTHGGAERLLQLHAKAQHHADAAMERQSQAWQQETLEELPDHEIQAVNTLLNNRSLTDPALRQWLAELPAGNWLPLVRTLANWARAMRRY